LKFRRGTQQNYGSPQNNRNLKNPMPNLKKKKIDSQNIMTERMKIQIQSNWNHSILSYRDFVMNFFVNSSARESATRKNISSFV
jgi:hypothetical protein